MYNTGHSLIEGTIEYDFADQLPHGSGIDASWEYHTTANYVYFCNSYHCMDEYGGYDGWQDFRIRISKPTFELLYDAIGKMRNYKEPSRQAMIKRVDVLLDIICEEFILQFTGNRYKAEKYFLQDYLVDTIVYSIGEMGF